MKVKKAVKKYYKKALAVGTAVAGIAVVDQTVKATRKIGKKDSHKFGRIMAESIIEVLGTVAWMAVASYIWNNGGDVDDLTDEQILALVRSKILDRLIEIRNGIENPGENDGGDIIEAIYDVKEAYETGSVVPNESASIDAIHKYIMSGDFKSAKDEISGLIDRVASGEMHIIQDGDNDENTGSGDGTPAAEGTETQFSIEAVINSARADLRAGKISAIDAVSAVMDAMEDAGIDNEDMEQKLTDEFAAIEASVKAGAADANAASE